MYKLINLLTYLCTGCRGQSGRGAFPLQVHRSLGGVQPQTGRASCGHYQADATQVARQNLQEDQDGKPARQGYEARLRRRRILRSMLSGFRRSEAPGWKDLRRGVAA